jgi:multiple sugar transport system permease protein
MIFLYAFLTVFAVASAFPFYYMLVTATDRTVDILRVPPPLWFGSSLMQKLQPISSEQGSLPYFSDCGL